MFSSGHGLISQYHSAAATSSCKSPARMQRHLEKLPPVPFDAQLINAAEWVKESLCYDEKILCIGHEIPGKLQDGPQ